MPTYVYESAKGKRIEKFFPMSRFPRVLVRRGVRYHLRIVPGAQVSVAKDISHIACTLPPWTPGAREYVTDRKSEHYGQPIVHNQQDRRNIEAASAAEGTGYVHDSRTDRSRPYSKPG